MAIRTAGAADLAVVLELAKAFYAEGGFSTPDEELRRNLAVLTDSSAARVAVAEVAGVVVGFAITTTSFGLENGKIAELQDLFVAPDQRGTGLGRALIEDTVAWCQDTGCHLIELVVAPQGPDAARLFQYYDRQGFVNEGRSLLVKDVSAG